MATLDTLSAMTKEVYGDYSNLVPSDQEVLIKMIGRVKSKKVGKEFTMAANLSLDHSTTYHGTNEETIDLEDVVDGKSANASIIPAAMSFSGVITQMMADRVIQGELAFVDGPKFVMDRSMLSFTKVIESTHNHGGNGIGTFTYNTADTSVITVDAAEWATAVWVGGIKKPVDVYAISGGVIGAKIVTTSVTKVDTKTRKLTLASVVGLSNAGTYIIFPKNAKDRESLGLFNILKKSSGSLFGLSIDENDLWGANQYDVNSVDFEWKNFAAAVAENSGRGVSGANYILLMNPIHFPKMIPDFNTASSGQSIASESGTNHSRIFTTGEQVVALKHGTDSIEFTINNMKCKVVTSDYVKRGEAALIDLDCWMRVMGGDGDIRFHTFESGAKLNPLPRKTASEYRLYSDQAIFCPELAKQIYFKNLKATSL